MKESLANIPSVKSNLKKKRKHLLRRGPCDTSISRGIVFHTSLLRLQEEWSQRGKPNGANKLQSNRSAEIRSGKANYEANFPQRSLFS